MSFTPKNPTFYDTVTTSPEWKAWQDEQARRAFVLSNRGGTPHHVPPVYDMAEVMECGWISKEHFQAFMDFTIEQAL